MTKYRRLAAAVAASVLMFTACGGGSDDAASDSSGPESTTRETTEDMTPETTEALAAGSASETTTSESSSTTTTTRAATTTTAATVTTSAAPTTTVPVPADTGRCLVGDWVVTQDQMNAYYAGLMSTLDAPLDISVVGSAPLSFRADGTYSWAPSLDLTVAVAGQSGTGAMTGSITGNWTASGGVVTTASDVNTLDVTVTIGSTTINGSDMANGILNRSPVNGVTSSCDGSTPVIDFNTADPAVTVPVTLTRA